MPLPSYLAEEAMEVLTNSSFGERDSHLHCHSFLPYKIFKCLGCSLWDAAPAEVFNDPRETYRPFLRSSLRVTQSAASIRLENCPISSINSNVGFTEE